MCYIEINAWTINTIIYILTNLPGFMATKLLGGGS